MSKLFLIFFLILLFPVSSLCEKIINMNLKSGINLSIIHFKDSSIRPGIFLGFESEPQINNKLKFSSGLCLSLRRGILRDKLIWSHPGILSLYDISYSIGCLEIPLLLKYSFPLNNEIL